VKTLTGEPLSLENLDSHHHVCDLINVQYPVLSLFTDGRQNWIYLWCDRSDAGLNRWLLFVVTRERLAKYLKGSEPMLSLVENADFHWVLDDAANDYFLSQPADAKRSRRYLRVVDLAQLEVYLPSEDSFFNEALTKDLDLTKQIVPQEFRLPIDGQWFSADFQFLFRRYERLYAFFYATRPRFVRSIEDTLSQLLRAPWTGGYSRVNLYQRLYQQIPGIHALRIPSMKYASPGTIEFEAIPEIGDNIQEATTLLLKHYAKIDAACKRVRKTLSSAHLNKTDLSSTPDDQIRLEAQSFKAILEDCYFIGSTLLVEDQFSTLRRHSPNTVVYGKAVVSFVRQLDKFADLRRRHLVKP
jgi:hypothetical protein